MTPFPREWKVDRLKDVSIINPTSLSANTDPDYVFDYLEISNVDYYGVIDTAAIERVRFENSPSRARRRVVKNSIVISSVRPNLQAVAFFTENNLNLICSTGFNVVQPIDKYLFPKFCYYVLISDYARQYFEATATGVGYPAIDEKFFSTIILPLPELFEQKLITAFLDISCSAIDDVSSGTKTSNDNSRPKGVLHRQMEVLVAYRKSLIHECITGKRRVTEEDLMRVHRGESGIEKVSQLV
jgi:type I restriction enzyme S subunit